MTSMRPRSDVVRLVAGALAAGAAAVGVVAAVLHPPAKGMPAVLMLVAAPVGAAVVAGLALRWWIGRARGLVRVLLAVAVVSAVLVAAAVALAAWRMFLSGHDAALVGTVVGLRRSWPCSWPIT